jgi:hypothetical protein
MPRTRPLAGSALHPGAVLKDELDASGSAAIWLRLQVAYDLSRAEAELADKIATEVSPAAA